MAVRELLPGIIEEHRIDFAVANCENAACGVSGVTAEIVEELYASLIDVPDLREPYLGTKKRGHGICVRMITKHCFVPPIIPRERFGPEDATSWAQLGRITAGHRIGFTARRPKGLDYRGLPVTGRARTNAWCSQVQASFNW